MELEFKKTYRIGPGQSADGRLRTSGLFRIFQNVSEEHVKLMGYGEAEDFMQGRFWAVTNYRAAISRMPREGETVEVRTAALKTKHLIFPRCYRMFSCDGELLCECSSRWVIVDFEKRTAVIPELPSGASSEYPQGWDIPGAGAVKSRETTESTPFDPPESFFDKNGHVNNAAYFDAAEEVLSDRIAGKTPSFLQIEYRNELPLGFRMTVDTGAYRTEDPASEGFYLCGSGEDKTFFKMRAEYR